MRPIQSGLSRFVRRVALLALAAAPLGGCTLMGAMEEKDSEKGITTVNVLQAIETDLSAYATLGLSLEVQAADAQAEAAQYLAQLRAKLEESGAFESVIELDDAADAGDVDLVLALTIIEVTKVSSGDRTWKGARAGPAVFGVSAVLGEPSSELATGSAAIVGSTKSTSVYSGTTEDAIRAAVEGTRRFLLES